jgi:hypothetical protein
MARFVILSHLCENIGNNLMYDNLYYQIILIIQGVSKNGNEK